MPRPALDERSLREQARGRAKAAKLRAAIAKLRVKVLKLEHKAEELRTRIRAHEETANRLDRRMAPPKG